MYYFAYANHNAVLNVLNEVKKSTKAIGKKIVKIAFYIEFLTNLVVIFSGYLSTLDRTNEIFIDR